MYICKNCGKIITDKEYKKITAQHTDAMGCGCFIWALVLLFCVSVILIPIAIILILMMNNKAPENTCPYCHAENSFIPGESPIAKKLMSDTYSEDEIKAIKEQEESNTQTIKAKKPISCIIPVIIIAVWILAIMLAGMFMK